MDNISLWEFSFVPPGKYPFQVAGGKTWRLNSTHSFPDMQQKIQQTALENTHVLAQGQKADHLLKAKSATKLSREMCNVLVCVSALQIWNYPGSRAPGDRYAELSLKNCRIAHGLGI